uniref:Rho guanine nucleotide exchange factor 5/35 N-terminal domain-containing protein n=1 Tax=Catagonus wagneri TaxID=51154 RepID=A0A8C3YIZ6_9CETA
MEAEEPQRGALTSIPTEAEFSITPAVPMRSSQPPALEPEAEGKDPSYKRAEGHPLLETQQRDVNDYANETMTSFPSEASVGVETDQETLMAEAWDTPEHQEAVPQSQSDSQAGAPTPSELQTGPNQDEYLERASVSSELGSSVEVEFRPEFTSLMLETGSAEEKEENSPDTSAQTRSGPACEDHPIETSQPQDSGSGTVRQEGPRVEGPLCLQEAEALGEQGPEKERLQGEGTLGEGVCSAGLLGEREQVGEQVSRTDREQRQKQEQIQDDVMLAKQGETAVPNRKLEGLSCGEWEWWTQGQGDIEQGEQKGRELTEPEASGRDAQDEETQSLAGKPVKETRKQEDQGLQGKVMPSEEQEEEVGSSEEEPGSLDMDTLEGEEEERGTEGEGELGGASTPSSVPDGESPDEEAVQYNQQEGSELEKGSASSQETEVVPGATPVTPPRTPESAPSSPSEVSNDT